MQFDLNCDLGEGESLARTKRLMAHITSANIACGGHAGDMATMRRCVRLARAHKVHIGAHPGPCDRENFGRSPINLEEDGLELLLRQQVELLERVATEEGVKLHHIKLHGGLYHATERELSLARYYLAFVQRSWPKLIVYALAGGTVARAARTISVKVWEEAFIDRNYRDDGLLVPRSEPDALLTRRSDLIDRMRLLMESRSVKTVTGKTVRLPARTVCLHSDTPSAVRTVRLARMCGLVKPN
jgi:5-oxoprolinase (ATP-hydrolysing) subunit A